MIQDRITQIALAKQSEKGTPAVEGTYQIGVNSGQVAMVELAEEDLPISWSSRLLEGHDRVSATPGTSFETLAMPASIGLLLALTLGGEAVTGNDPYTHTFTPAISLPYATVFARKANEYFQVSDVRINELELAWEKTGAVTVSVSGMGCDFDFLASPYTGGTDERPNGGVFKGAGGTFEVNGVAAVVESGSISISNNLEAVHGSDNVLPADVFPGGLTVTLSLTIVPNDLTEWRRVLTGAVDGNDITATPNYGSCELGFAVDATTTLTFNGKNVRFLTDMPDTNAQGGPVRLTLEGSVATPSDNDAFDFVLVNSVDTAY